MSESIWLAWNADPSILLGIPLSALLYARGIRALGSHRRYHRRLRIVSFYTGLTTVFLALASPLDALSDRLFLSHMVQHLLVIFVAIPAIQLSAPVIPILRGVPRGIRRACIVPFFKSGLTRLVLRTLSRPLVAWPLFVGTLVIWHFPFAFEAALNNEFIHIAEHLAFALGAYLWWWNVIDPLPLRANLSYLARVPFVFITIVPSFALGAFLTFAPNAWYPTYALTAPEYGLSALEDQQLGGLIMWIPGSFIIAATLLMALYYAVRKEQQEQLAREAANAKQ